MNNITDIDFSHLPYVENVEEAVDLMKLKHKAIWLMPQLVALFGSFKPILGEDGLYDPKATLAHNIGENDQLRGMYLMVMKTKRSILLASQTSPSSLEYCTLVPLILSGFKKHQDIPYSRWSKDGLKYIVEPMLYAAMTCENIPELSKERLLELRADGLIAKTGKSAGSSRSPLSTWRLLGTQGTELHGLPHLVCTMLTQIWAAHPLHRNKYMVLDPQEWDNAPEPLVTADIMPNKKVEKPVMKPNKMPWED